MGAGEFAESEAERAFVAILRAEREAQDAVTGCKAEGEAFVAAARERSNRIAERAERRISRLRERMDAAAERRVAEFSRPVAPAGSGDVLDTHLDGAVNAVARELTGTA